MEKQDIKKAVRADYAKVANGESSCSPAVSSCCGTSYAEMTSQSIGYAAEQLKDLPEGANLGLGCGNPLKEAQLKEGEAVLDLGSGGGIDCFLAAEAVGKTGRVIGVDMTPEMIEKARHNARTGKFHNVEFRLGEIEHLPVSDQSVDVIVSNCVINLAPDKSRVFQDAHRALKPGGRFVVSDIVINSPLPDWIMESVKAYTGCISGALEKSDYLKIIKEAGFDRIEIVKTSTFPIESMQNDPTAQTLIQKSGISSSELNETLQSVESITVIGYKS